MLEKHGDSGSRGLLSFCIRSKILPKDRSKKTEFGENNLKAVPKFRAFFKGKNRKKKGEERETFIFLPLRRRSKGCPEIRFNFLNKLKLYTQLNEN